MLGNEQTYLDRYRRHNAEVKEYSKGRDDFLVFQMGDGDAWPKLRHFFGAASA
jgi:hypothetical protein